MHRRPFTLFKLESASDLLEKLRRDAEVLRRAVTSDHLFNFVVTGYSLIDWVKHDPSVPNAAKHPKVIQGLYEDPWLKACGDLATAAKHFTLTRRTPIVESTSSRDGYGVGRYGRGAYGIGEEALDIVLTDGTKFESLALVDGVLATWHNFFSKYCL